MALKNILNFWFKINDKIRFLLVGGYNTLFSFSLFCLLQTLFGSIFHYIIILLFCHLISVFNSFVSLKYFVFRSPKNFLNEYLKVNIVYAIYFVLNATLLYVQKDLLEVNIYIAQFICIIILTIASYFSHKYFSFK
jgi:putative flippase GtrA